MKKLDDFAKKWGFKEWGFKGIARCLINLFI